MRQICKDRSAIPAYERRSPNLARGTRSDLHVHPGHTAGTFRCGMRRAAAARRFGTKRQRPNRRSRDRQSGAGGRGRDRAVDGDLHTIIPTVGDVATAVDVVAEAAHVATDRSDGAISLNTRQVGDFTSRACGRGRNGRAVI